MDFNFVTGTVLTALVGLAVWFFQNRIEAVRKERELLQTQRRELYLKILDPYIAILSNTGQNQPKSVNRSVQQILSMDYRRMSFELLMIGSDEVVLALNDVMQYSYKMPQTGQVLPQDLVSHWGGLLLAIRRDLGNNKTELKEIDMFRSFIKDIDEAVGQDS